MAMTSAEITAAIAEGKAAVDSNDWSTIKAGIASSTKGADVRKHIYAEAHAASLVVEKATEAMEDYPELKADVTDNIRNESAKTEVTIDLNNYNVVHGIFNASGIWQSDSSRIITKQLIDISEFKAVKVTIPSGYRYNIAFYDKNDETSFTKLFKSIWVSYSSYIIPLGRYMRIQAYNTSESVTELNEFSNFTITGINGATFSSIMDEKSLVLKDGCALSDVYTSFEQGYYNTSTETIVDSDSFVISGYISVSKFKKIFFNKSDPNIWSYVIFFDSGKTFISASQPIKVDEAYIDVSCASYIRVQIRATSGTIYTADPLDKIDILRVVEDSAVTSIPVQYSFVQGALINGDISSASTRIATKVMTDITDYDSISIQCTNGYYFALCFFTENTTESLAGTTGWQYSNNEYIAFDTSKFNYFRITIRNSGNENITPDNGIQITDISALRHCAADDYAGLLRYEGNRIVINPTVRYSNLIDRLAAIYTTNYSLDTYFQQGACIHNGTMFAFRHHGVCTAIDLNTMKVVGEFEISEITSDLPHCDNASFSFEYPDNNTDFPYCYVSRTTYPSEASGITKDVYNECYVMNITSSEASVVQRIRFDDVNNDFAYGSIDWVVDAERNRIIAYHQTNAIGTSDQPWLFKEFNLPKISDGEIINLTESDVLTQWTVLNVSWGHTFGICQGVDVSGRYIFAPCSRPSINKEALVVLDKYDHQIVACMEWDKDKTDELQSAAVYNGALYLVAEGVRIDRLLFD